MPETPCTVGDVMTQTVVAVGSEAPFKETVELLDQWKVSALPVLAGEGRVVGVVSEADLLPKEEFRDTGGPGGPARSAVKPLPVVDEVGLLQGVVSRSDLLKGFLRDEEIAEEVRRHVLTRLPVTTHLSVSVTEGVVTLGGSLPDRPLGPVIARAVRSVEGVVDVRLELTHR
ncbi:CBS domain-containing protein [Streptomyces sp. NPDC001435]|uniref:CBS domain-containing protein n=1 Tax=Streptomyces sp. NPDC001435 TaxID=3364576 RepID=UPI003689A2C9